MVAGGRERDVAVAGFLLGGGTSLYTCRAGFGCDQVVTFEVVLADGSIVHVNRDEHADLFKVLKGGGNNFGIVTRFDMQAFPVSPSGIWDAVMRYPAEAMDELLEAHFDFSKGLNDTSDAHILPFVSSIPLTFNQAQSTDHRTKMKWYSSTKSQTPVITVILTHLDGLEDSKSLSRLKTITGSQVVHSGVTTVAKKMETLATPPGEYVSPYEFLFHYLSCELIRD
jgi:FAD/FMN-containing dehydrogenase